MIEIYSPNMIKTFISCPKKYYYKYIENISAPQSSLPFEKGKKIHALANYYLQGINIEKLEKTLNEKERQAWTLLKENEFYNKEYFKSEFQISAKVSKYWVGGRIDAIVKDGGKYYILDYKTGSTPKNPEYDFQTMIYFICADKFLKNYDSLFFVYINLKDKNNYIIEFTPQMKNLYEKKIIEICNQISTSNIYPSACKECAADLLADTDNTPVFCEYKKLCL